ncbi:unnamed protein product [Lactuca virosa]|uniref:Uncharacterized protein n=1 Tax=Lactuca virosa TaxID=75947 RepID=A0AAU9LLL7_9ASTR|nr:unnamed protein product [Lactuca virosa]
MGLRGLRKQLLVNVEGTTKVTNVVLTGMMKRNKGAIVNIGSSVVVVTPSSPLYALYAATKAMKLAFPQLQTTKSLNPMLL